MNLFVVQTDFAITLSSATAIAQECHTELVHKILATDAAESMPFGYSVAIDGSIAIIGAHYDDDNGLNSGSAYLFDAVTGAQLFKLLPDDGAAHAWFGSSVAIDGRIAIAPASRIMLPLFTLH